MILNDNQSVFPVLRTKNIVITHNRVSIDFSLSTRDENSKSSWIGSSQFKNLIKVYFFLVPESRKQEFKGVTNPKTRLFAMTPGGQPPLNAFNTIIDLKLNFNHKQVSFAEIFNSDYRSEPAQTMFYQDSPESIINDISYETDIDIENVDLEREDAWHLYSFVHLDIEEITTNYALYFAANPDVFAGFGGNSTIDILLKKNRNGKLLVPNTVDVLYTPPPSQAPYFGPAHYHGPENPGPDGYIGWMEGHADGEMGNKLDVKTQRYTKVVAKNFIDDTGFMSGFFGGETYPFESLDQDGGTTGSSVEKVISLISGAKEKILGFSKLADQKRNARQRACMYYSKLNQSNILISAAASCIMVPRDSPSSEHHHCIAFAINYADLLTIYSPLGWLYEYHAASSATAIEGQESPSYPMLSYFLHKSGHKQMILKRRRLTNSPIGTNKCNTSKYETYQYEPDTKLILTCADKNPTKLSHGLQRESNIGSQTGELSNITELNIDYTGAEWEDIAAAINRSFYNPVRVFYVEDYDLFRNVNFGNYTYDIELYLVDGIKHTVEEIYTRFKKSLLEFMKYYNYSNIPHNSSPYTQEETNPEFWLRSQADITPGSFDFLNNKYTEHFRASATDKYSQIIEEVILKFRECYSLVANSMLVIGGILENAGFTTAEEIHGDDNQWNQLKSFIHPETLQPGSLEIFLDMCREMENTLNNLLNYSKITDENMQKLQYSFLDSNSINHVGTVKPGNNHISDNLISLSANIPVTAQALSGTEILYEPVSFAEYDHNSPAVIRDTLENTATPTDFFKINDIHSDETPSTSPIVSQNSSHYFSAKGAIIQAIYGQADKHGVLEPSMPIRPEALTNYSSTLSGIGSVTISFGLSKVLGRIRNDNKDTDQPLPTSDRENTQITREIEEAICFAALSETKREQFIENISNTYRDLVLGLDALGSLWDEVQSLAAGFAFTDSTVASTTKTDWQNIANSPNPAAAMAADRQVQSAMKSIHLDNKMELRRMIPGFASSVALADAPDSEGRGQMYIYEPAENTSGAGIIVNNLFFNAEALSAQTSGGRSSQRSSGGSSSSSRSSRTGGSY